MNCILIFYNKLKKINNSLLIMHIIICLLNITFLYFALLVEDIFQVIDIFSRRLQVSFLIISFVVDAVHFLQLE